MGKQGVPGGPLVMTAMGILLPTTKAGKIAYLRDVPGIKSEYRRLKGQRAHRLIVEERTGIKLPAKAVVHHVDPNDKRANLGHFVVCEDAAYHALIERRTRALAECGHAGWRKCYRCGVWDDPKNLIQATRRKPRRGLFADVVHAKRNGVCVPVGDGMTPDAHHCHAAPRGRHRVGRLPRIRRKYVGVGLDATCLHCGLPVRRPHTDSVRWYAPTRQS